jgi:hypothetical protein
MTRPPKDEAPAWWRAHTNADDPKRIWTGTTSVATFSEVWSAVPPLLKAGKSAHERWLASLDEKCRQILEATPARSERLPRAWYADQTIRLIAALRACLDRGDAMGAAEVGNRLGEHVTDWRRKDFTEYEYTRGGKNLRAARAAAKARATSAAGDSRAEEWAARVANRRPGASAAQVYLRIAIEDDPVMDGPELKKAVGRVKKAVQRFQKRTRSH